MATDGSEASNPQGRVLVLLDGSRLSLAAVNVAAEHARERGLGVLGIFVEETNLLRSAGYGFACEVGASSGLVRPLDSAHLQTRIAAMARQAQRTLEQATAAQGIPQSLQHCHGQVVQEVLNLATPEDLLILGRVGWSATPGVRLGSTARALLHQAPGDVMLWAHAPARARDRIVVVLNHHQGTNHRAIELGVALAQRHRKPLTILLRTDDTGADNTRDTLARDTNALDTQANELLRQLDARGIPARVRPLVSGGMDTLTRVLREEAPSHLVLSRGSSLFRQQEADDLLLSLNLPVTITR